MLNIFSPVSRETEQASNELIIQAVRQEEAAEVSMEYFVSVSALKSFSVSKK